MAVAETPTEPVRDAFRAAFDAAVKEHTPTETPDPTPSEPPDAQPDGEEPTPETAPGALPDTKPTESGLLSDDEFTALQTKHANDPIALRKSLEGAFTKKTQALAAQRQTYERFEKYAPFLDAFETDAEGTLRQLAERNGLTLTPKAPEPAPPSPLANSFLSDFRKELGPDNEYLADILGPALTKVVEKAVASTVDQTVAPLRAQTTGLLEKVAVEQTEAVMKAFTAEHPDWTEHEDAMMKLSLKIAGDGSRPLGMTEAEYLDHLYKTVTRDAWEANKKANIEREVSGRFKKLSAKVDGAESDPQLATTPDADVRKRPTGPVDFAQAYRDAKAGIRYED